MKEFYSEKYDSTFYVDNETLYVLLEEENEWDPIDWNVVAEDPQMLADFARIFASIVYNEVGDQKELVVEKIPVYAEVTDNQEEWNKFYEDSI
jgi:hypothetical protein